MITPLFIFFVSCYFLFLCRIRRFHKPPVRALVAIFTINLLVFAVDVQTAHAAEAVAVNQQRITITVTPSDPAKSARTFRVVLVCDTPESRSNGLQGFRKLTKDEAALFIFDEPEHVSFWMASVKYPIDIVFVGPDKKVTRVYANRKPGSKELYPSGKPAKWVIETAAGSKIRVGDKVGFQ